MNQSRSVCPTNAMAAAGAILDLDGTLIRENEPLAGAKRLLSHFEGRFVIASNNSSDTARTLSVRLAGIGLDVPAQGIFLAGEEALRRIAADHPGARILLLAAAPLQSLARALGLKPSLQDGDVVLICRDVAFDYCRLRRAANCLDRGAPLYAANPDVTHPGADGDRVPETGALLAALLACSRHVTPTVIGKPHHHLYSLALARLGIAAQHAIVIGDNPDTDIVGARAMGIASVLIGPHRDAVARDPADLLQDSRFRSA